MSRRTLVTAIVLPAVVALAAVAPAPFAGAGSEPAGAALTVVALGDSWPAGAHCGGCRTFMGRYADGLASTLGAEVDFVDLTQATIPGTNRGQTASSLLDDLQTSDDVRAKVGAADVIVIHTGINELDTDAYAGLLEPDDDPATCGWDEVDCVRELGDHWRTTFDAMLDEISSLHVDHPVAVRLVTAENIFLSDAGLRADFGDDFGYTTGRMIVDELTFAMCGAAADHDAVCIDTRRLLNGPTLVDGSRDENDEATHQAIADALVATGLPELDGGAPATTG